MSASEPKDKAIRTTSGLRDFLELRIESRRDGTAWAPPNIGSLVEVHVQDETMGRDEFEWRLAEVRRIAAGKGGRFEVCVQKRDGSYDEQFHEWYWKDSFNVEWRLPTEEAAAATKPRKVEAPAQQQQQSAASTTHAKAAKHVAQAAKEDKPPQPPPKPPPKPAATPTTTTTTTAKPRRLHTAAAKARRFARAVF